MRREEFFRDWNKLCILKEYHDIYSFQFLPWFVQIRTALNPSLCLAHATINQEQKLWSYKMPSDWGISVRIQTSSYLYFNTDKIRGENYPIISSVLPSVAAEVCD